MSLLRRALRPARLNTPRAQCINRAIRHDWCLVFWMRVANEGIMSVAATPARTLTVVQLIPALHSGGAERSVLEVGQALVQAGHRSIVISAGGRLVKQLEAEGSEHVTLDIGQKSLLTLGRLGRLRSVL